MPPSKMITRSRVAARKSRIPRNRSATLTHLWQGLRRTTSEPATYLLLDQIGRDGGMVRCVPRADLHQHLWPDGLIRALAERVEPPRLRRGAGGWTLELPGEPPQPVALADHDPVARALEAERDGIDLVG